MQTVVLLQDAPHAAAIRAALCELGYHVLAELDRPATLHHEVERLAPDLIIVATETPGAETLASLASIASSCPRPVVMFAREGGRELIRKAVECGVAAYVIDGWARERLVPIIEAAVARFDAHQAIKRDLASTRAKLSERKVIEKAKGIVMEQRRLSENEAYGALRKMAMDQNLALAELARRVVAVAHLLN